jgi:hypothetical protein
LLDFVEDKPQRQHVQPVGQVDTIFNCFTLVWCRQICLLGSNVVGKGHEIGPNELAIYYFL